jgi:hypothetical protein
MISQKTYLTRIFPIFVFIIYLSLIISRLLWPLDASEPYSDIWETISGLGDMEENPVGFYFFQIAMAFYGLIIFPIIPYIHPKLMAIGKKTGMVKMGTFWLTIGAVGMLLTGLIPDGIVEIPEWDKFHEITSGAGFGGVLFAAFFYFFPCKAAGDKINQKVLLLITLMWWISIIIFGISYGMAEFVIKEQNACDLGWYGPEWGECGVSGFYSFSVWERILFTIGLIYLALLVYMIPVQIPPTIKTDGGDTVTNQEI